MSDKLFGVIYKSTVLIPESSFYNKFVIGLCSCSSVKEFEESGYFGSSKYINRVVNKYGRDRIKTDILYCMFDNNVLNKKEKRNQLGELERHFIKLYDSRNPEIGMNLTPGGDGGIGNYGKNKGIRYYGEKKEKFKKSLKARHNISLAKKQYYDTHPKRKLSEEDKNKKRIAALKRWQDNPRSPDTEETKQRKRAWQKEYYKVHDGHNKGKKWTEERIKKQKDFWKEYYKTHNGHNKGKTYSKICKICNQKFIGTGSRSCFCNLCQKRSI